MIRAVGNKRLDLSDSEYKYYCDIKDKFGESDFVGLFKTDKNGIITSVNPPMNKNISFGVLFFLLNIMMNQRIRTLDGKINKVDKFLEVHNIVERLENLENKN